LAIELCLHQREDESSSKKKGGGKRKESLLKTRLVEWRWLNALEKIGIGRGNSAV